MLFSARSHGFRGVVVITPALHAEGREFEPRRNLVIFILMWKKYIVVLRVTARCA